MLVMLVNSIQSQHAFCSYLWTKCCVPVRAFAHTQQHLFPNSFPFWLSRKMPGRIGHLIKDLSLDDVPLRRQGCPTGEVMCIWALCGFMHHPVTALDQKETRKSYCSMPETNTHALLCSGWCVQWGCDTAAVSFSESENVMLASGGSCSTRGSACDVLHWCCLPCNIAILLDVSEIQSQFSQYFNL